MARAHAELSSDPEQARKDAAEADKALPGHAAPAVIEARAALSLGSLESAAKAFEKARGIDPRSVEDPATMHDLARVLAKTGKTREALSVYQALVPRVDLLGSPDTRVLVLLSAAYVSMAQEAADRSAGKARGEEKAGADETKRAPLEEAIAYLREARQRPPTQLSGDVVLSLALMLDRSGDKAQADAALTDAERMGARLRAGTLDYLADPNDRDALSALSLEQSDRAGAGKQWESFLSGPAGAGPWAAAARARLAELRKAGGAKGAGAPVKSTPGKKR